MVAIHGQYDIDSWTRDALAGEVYASWSHEGLKANAVAARGVAWYHYRNPEQPSWFNCSPVTGYDLTTRRIQGWNPSKMVSDGNSYNYPNNRVTDTMLQVLVTPSEEPAFYNWMATHQTSLESASGSYTQRLSQVYPNYVVRRIDNLEQEEGEDFSLQGSSMTNRTYPPSYPGWGVPGQYNPAATPINTAREAEQYWGLKHVDRADDNPFGQRGRYMVSLHMGDLLEYPMYIGAACNRLHLIGISDRPTPVYVNIYVDGKYKTNMAWDFGDNQRHLIIREVPNLEAGCSVRTVAVQFRNDQWVPGGGEDQDRNLYLDVIAVSQ